MVISNFDVYGFVLVPSEADSILISCVALSLNERIGIELYPILPDNGINRQLYPECLRDETGYSSYSAICAESFLS